ncbi:MAG: SGNH/GDSL hydrolase family protein [Luteolibacter sp.]
MNIFPRSDDERIRVFTGFILLLFQIAPHASGQSPEVKIMPLGDSITRGTNDINYPNGSIPGGYRKELGIRLTNVGLPFDFVGNSIENAFPGMDPEHEGHDGYRTDEILAHLPAWLAVNPDIVLLHAGSNDILQDVPVATAVNRLSSLIDAITVNAPDRRLFVATLIPITQSWQGRTAAYLNGNVDSFNASARNLVAQYAGAGRKVVLVEMNSGIVLTDPIPANNFYQPGDGVHPGQAGYNQMGAIWFGAVSSGWPQFPAPPPGAPGGPTALAATVISGTRINLSWTDNSNNETSFKVFWKTGTGGTWQPLANIAQDTTIFSAGGLQTGVNSYSFAVRASNASGDSAWSNIASSFPVNVALNKPASASSVYSPANVASKANNGNLNEYWSATLNDPMAAWKVDLSENFRISGLQIVTRQDADQPVTRKNFEVRASNDPEFSSYVVLANQGESSLPHASTLVASVNATMPYRYLQVVKTDGAYFSFTEMRAFGVVPPPAPAPPSGLAVSHTGESEISLVWSDNSPTETGFKIERKTGNSGTFSEIATVSANAVRFSDTGLTASTHHVYRIRATNGVDDSGYTNEASAVTLATGSYEAWAANYPQFLVLPAASQTPAADPNNDGVGNLLAYAMNLDPLAVPPEGSLPFITLENNGDTLVPLFHFRRSRTAGVVFDVLASPDLSVGGWQTQDQSSATSESINGDPSTELVTVPLEAGAERKFVRLRVVR